MFGKSSNKNGSTASLIANHINDNTTINGDIQANSDMRIDGNVKGNIVCTSKVVIGKTSKVEGNIKCTDLTIEGIVTGDVIAENILHFRQSSTFEGNIKYNKLIVEEGANIVGSLVQNRKNVSINEAKTTNQQQIA
jgi:cytoskeletal protein CcmA (bactofilin family)